MSVLICYELLLSFLPRFVIVPFFVFQTAFRASSGFLDILMSIGAENALVTVRPVANWVFLALMCRFAGLACVAFGGRVFLRNSSFTQV